MSSGEILHSAALLIPGDRPSQADGALLVRRGRIAAVGDTAALRREHPDARHCDHAGAILLPAFVNAHTHLELTDFPAWSEEQGQDRAPEDFVDWILRLINVKRRLDGAAYLDSLRHGIQLSLASGTAAVGDILAHYDARAQYNDSPLRGCLFLETLGRDPAVIQRLKRGLDKALDGGAPGRMSLGLSPHAPYTIRADYLAYVYRLCRKRALPCTTHLAESPDEVEFVEQGRGALAGRLYPQIGWQELVPRGSGLRPVRWLAEQGGLFPGNLLVHGVQLNDDEVRLLADNGMSLALCPRSNARLNVGRAPVRQLQQAGVRLTLGTDSRASCESLSVRDEMIFAHRWFNGALDAATLFHMATLGGAAALGLERQLGSLTVGKDASFQVLRPNSTVALPELFDYLVSVPEQEDLHQVYLRGEPRLPQTAPET